jgi:hypothetical protein
MILKSKLSKLLVLGNFADGDPPVLQSASVRDNSLVAGETVTIDYSATDVTGIRNTTVSYTGPNGVIFGATDYNDDGVAELSITGSLPDGTYSLRYVFLSDSINPSNDVKYHPNGTFSTSAGTFTHNVDLANLSFTVLGNPTANAAPTANAGVAQGVASGASVTLDGSGSTDSDGTIANPGGYAWSRTGGTGGSITLKRAVKKT